MVLNGQLAPWCGTVGSGDMASPWLPQLSMLVIKTLNKFLARSSKLEIIWRLVCQEQVMSFLLYADDMVIFCHPDETNYT